MPTSLRTFTALTALLIGGSSCNIGLEYASYGTDSNGDPIFPDTEESDADTDADADADGDTDSDADTDGNVEVSDVEPSYGTTAGGQTVTIRGGPFDESATVRFGGNTANVQSYGVNSLVVTTPATSSEGSVDVIVATDGGSGSAQDAYFYFLDGSGLGGAIGHFSWYHYVGTYWDGTPSDFGSAWLTFIEPDDFHLWEWYAPGTDNCVNGDYSTGSKVYVYDLGASSATVSPSTGNDINMPWQGSPYYWFVDDELTSAQFPTGGSYSLDPISSSSFPSLSINRMVDVPASFGLTSPAITGNQVAMLGRSELNFRWSGGSYGDKVIIELYLYTSTGGLDQSVTCVVSDDGNFTVPESAWTGYPSDRQVTVAISRWNEGDAIIDFNNSEARVVASYGLVGAFFTR
jgi:hypothetical protein